MIHTHSVAVYCSVWQHVAACCRVLQRVACSSFIASCVSSDLHTHFKIHTHSGAVCCSMLQHVAECCNLLHVLRLLHAAFLVIRTCCIPGEMPSYAPRISRDPRTYFVTRAILAGCSMLQCVAVCCSVLQCERSHPIPSAFLVIHTHILSHAHYSPVVVCCSVLQCVAVCCSARDARLCSPYFS